MQSRLLHQQQRSLFKPPKLPQHHITYRRDRFAGPIPIPINTSLDWPEARISQRTPASPAPSFHSEQDPSTGRTSFVHTPIFTRPQSENSLTTDMAPYSEHSQPFSFPAPGFQDQLGRAIPPIRNGGVELLEHKNPGVVPRLPLPESSPRFDPRCRL